MVCYCCYETLRERKRRNENCSEWIEHERKPEDVVNNNCGKIEDKERKNDEEKIKAHDGITETKERS